MTRTRTLMLLAGCLVAVLAGCGADVPENPSWVADVHPIMVARCIRCHNANLTTDPLSPSMTPIQGDFDHDSLSDFGPVEMSFVNNPILLPLEVSSGEMPPPPAAKLADWQIETLTRWIAEKPPM